jgi:hypothetical protein
MQCGGMTDFSLAARFVSVHCLSEQKELLYKYTARIMNVSNETRVYIACRFVLLG